MSEESQIKIMCRETWGKQQRPNPTKKWENNLLKQIHKKGEQNQS